MTGMETMMIISLVSTVAGAAVSAASAVQQGEAGASAANYNAQVSQQNSTLAIQAGNEEVKREQRAAAQRRGTLIAFGGSGIGLLDQLEDSAKEERLARNTIIHGATLQAIGLNNKTNLLRAEAADSRAAGNLSAAGSLLEGGLKLASGLSGASSPSSSSVPVTPTRNFGRRR